MSAILSWTETGYRQVCSHCDGTGEDRDAFGADGGCPYCILGVEEIEYYIDEWEDRPVSEEWTTERYQNVIMDLQVKLGEAELALSIAQSEAAQKLARAEESINAWQTRCSDIGNAANEAAANSRRECERALTEAAHWKECHASVSRTLCAVADGLQAAQSEAARVRAETMEECARVCDEQPLYDPTPTHEEMRPTTPQDCARLIRALPATVSKGEEKHEN